MPKLFIPPEGAMQFEFNSGYESRGRKWVWVEPVPNDLCPGGKSYRNLEWKDLMLCTCIGRIIE